MAQQAIPLDKLPSVLRSGKINAEQAKRAFFKNARMLLIAETKKCFDEGRGPDGGEQRDGEEEANRPSLRARPPCLSPPRLSLGPSRRRGTLRADLSGRG